MKPETLLDMAREAARSAYSPYSRFHVGAALACADGTVIAGANVENSSYGLTMCAERSAVFRAVSGGRLDFSAMAVYAESGSNPRTFHPCGACLQVLAEFCAGDFKLYVADDNSPRGYKAFRLDELLPHPFGLETGKSGEREDR